MRRSRAATALFCTLLSTALSAQKPDGSPTAPLEIRALESELARALHAGDRARLEELLADGYVLRGAPDVDRETWLRNATELCWGDRSDIDAYQARALDGVWVASFELTFYMDPATCRPAVLRSVVTDVWVRVAGAWKLQVRHASPSPAGAGIAAQFGLVPQPEPAWRAASELSFVETGGNTSTRTLGLTGSIEHRARALVTSGAVGFLTSEVDDSTKARSLRLQIREGFQLSDRTSVYGQVAYARDRFAGIDGRTAITAGLARTALATQRHVLKVQAGLGLTIETRVTENDLRFATATGALDYKWTIAPGTDVSDDMAFDADLETGGNWRGTNAVAVNVTLTRVLSLRASQALEYRHAPVAGFGRWDARTSVGLVFRMEQRPAVR